MLRQMTGVAAGLVLLASVAVAQDGTITLTPDASCYSAGATVTVTVELSDVTGVDEVVGGQFRLWYDTTALTVDTVSAADTVFTTLLFQGVVGAEIDVMVGVPVDPPGPGALSGTMAVITFTAAADVCNQADLVTFRADDPPLRTRLSAVLSGETVSIQSGALTRHDLAAITINDTTDPVATAPTDVTVECEADVPAGVTTYAEYVAAGGTASDNCTVDADLTIDFADGALTDPCGGTITRTYTITDTCGNFVDVIQTITVNDTTDPVATAPTDITVECEADEPGVTTYAEYVAAGGTASDNCTAGADLTIGFADGALTDPCGGTITRTYTITDACGNFVDVIQTITVNDTTDPAATAPTDVTVECEADAPAGVTTYAEYVAAGGTASDNCTAGVDLTIGFADGALTDPCGGTITRTYTITDACGNFLDVVQTITVNDTTDPAATAPTDATVECEVDVPAGVTTYAEYVAAGGTASDNCTADVDLTIGFADGALTDPCGGTITRTYTLTDACGNFVDVAQTITVSDTIAPTFDLPADVSANADAGTCDTLTLTLGDIGWPSNLADNCSDLAYLESQVTWVRSDAAVLLDDPFTNPVTTITWSVADECGNFETASGLTEQTITILPYNDVVVDVELDGSLVGTTFTRCLTLWLADCDGATFTTDAEATFVDGVATNVPLEVDCGLYDCIMVEDGLHTIRRRVDAGADFAIVGTEYVATLTGLNKLIQGDLYNDLPAETQDVIDILDFGVYITRWGYAYDDATCATPFPHADLNDDSLVDVSDFSFIQLNIFEIGDVPCCATLAGSDVTPITSISVAELEVLGLAELAVADLNEDGFLDLDDLAAFMSGEVPDVEPPMPGDLNCDGAVNTFDIDPFVLAVTDPAAFVVEYPTCDIGNGDVNGDGTVDWFDIDPFVSLLMGG